MLAAHTRATARGAMIVDPTHWDGLPDGHTRATTVENDRDRDARERTPTDPTTDDPLAWLLTPRPAPATPLARRAPSVYDTAAGLAPTVTEPGRPQ